jgi:hypothetical protein
MTTYAQNTAAWEVKRQSAPQNAIAELSRIPGVGQSIASDLYLICLR